MQSSSVSLPPNTMAMGPSGLLDCLEPSKNFFDLRTEPPKPRGLRKLFGRSASSRKVAASSRPVWSRSKSSRHMQDLSRDTTNVLQRKGIPTTIDGWRPRPLQDSRSVASSPTTKTTSSHSVGTSTPTSSPKRTIIPAQIAIVEESNLQESLRATEERFCRMGPTSASALRPSVAIGNDQFMLRGTEETLAYVQSKKLLTTQCGSCRATWKCILDAEYLLCPGCQTMDRLWSGTPGGGVAMGMDPVELEAHEE